MGHVIGTDTTYTGNPVSFNAVNGGKMKSISVPFSYTQDLHGYSNPWPAGGGKNKLNPLATYKGCSYNAAVGTTLNPVAADKSWQDAGDDTFTISNLGSWSQACLISDPLPLGKAYVKISNVIGAIRCSVYVCNGDFKVNRVSYNRNPVPEGDTIVVNTTFTNDDTYFVVYLSGNGADASIQYPYVYSGDTAATDSFSPYSNICPISGLTGLSVYVSPTQDPDDATVYNVDWTTQAGTVYGGTLDVVTGQITMTMANIASYNGETIGEPWVSSMDAYVSGNTPTTGAQVVYTLATPQTIQLTPKTINALVGQNYIWSSNSQTLSVVLTAPATGFAGWLIKCVTNGTPVEIPLKYMRAETYTVTPDQRMEWSAERDVTGVLHRETVQNLPPKIEFNTPLMTNSDINALNNIIKAAFTNYLQRNITIQFYDPERDQYWEWDCYMPDVKYHIRNADTATNIINYEELRYAFIGY